MTIVQALCMPNNRGKSTDTYYSEYLITIVMQMHLNITLYVYYRSCWLIDLNTVPGTIKAAFFYICPFLKPHYSVNNILLVWL